MSDIRQAQDAPDVRDGLRDAEFEHERLLLAATDAICEAMEADGVTKADLARRLDTTRSHVTQTLAGSRSLSLRTLSGLAHALGRRAVVRLVRPGAASPAAEVRALREALRGMVESYDLLHEQAVAHFRNEVLQGVIAGAFMGSIGPARRALDASPTDSGTVGRTALDPAHIGALEHVIREYERAGQVVCFPRADGTPDTCGRLARQAFVLLLALTGMRASGDAADAAGEDGHA